MPLLGLTMEEGPVAEWLKQEGEAVKKDEPLLTVEMDKGTVEVPAPASGVLRRIVVQQGTTVPVRTLIAEIGEPGEVASSSPPADSNAPAGASSGSPAASAAGTGSGSRGGAARDGVASGSRDGGGGGRLFASPRARMRARAMGVDLGPLPGSGPFRRILQAAVVTA